MEGKTQEPPLIVQAIDENLEFQNNFEETIQKSQFAEIGFNYFSVFILGCQSTGKSTLLNALFDTNFEVMVASRGKHRTTQGIWLGAKLGSTGSKSVLVFDVEGTDSAERLDEHVVFERKTSLFSLALSEILIINLLVANVGQFEGTNLGLLRSVFELNLQHFQKNFKNKKLLLFVLRDYDGEIPIDLLSKRVTDDVCKVWDLKIQKPEQYINSTIDQFFDLDFVVLPHYKFQKEKWFTDVKLLRDRFENPENEKYIFKSSYKTDIPSDGFPTYAKKIWNVILHEKDLDLPTQKEMLALVRCGEIKKEAFSKIEPKIEEMGVKIVEESEIFGDFGKFSKEMINSCLKEYHENASRYDKKIRDERGQELEQSILTFLKEYYHFQQKLIIAHCSNFITEQTNYISKTEFQSELMTTIKKINRKTVHLFESMMNSSIVPDSNWEYKRELEEMNEIIKTTVDGVKEIQFNIYAGKMKNELKKKLINLLQPALEKADPNLMWDTIRDIYNGQLKNLLEDISKILIEFEYSDGEQKSKLNNQEKAMFSLLKDIVQEKANNLDLMMINKFKKAFLEDEDETPITWGSNDDLITPYKKAKISSELLVDLFSVIRLEETSRRGHHYCFFEPKDSGEVILVETLPEVEEDRIIITPSQGRRILDVFRSSAFTHYQMAQKDKEHAAANQSIPSYFIALLLILGANEIWYVISMFIFNPIIGLVFLFILVTVAFIIKKFNLWPMIYGTVSMGVKTIMASQTPTTSRKINNNEKEKDIN